MLGSVTTLYVVVKGPQILKKVAVCSEDKLMGTLLRNYVSASDT